MDHDRLFKELLTTFFVEFVELFLPDVAIYMDRDHLEFLDKEVFTDIASGERHEVDLLVKARIRGQGDVFFLIHVENQSRPGPDFARRMFRYFARLYEKYGLPIIPVVIFSYDQPLRPEPDHFRVEIQGYRVLDFTFRVIKTSPFVCCAVVSETSRRKWRIRCVPYPILFSTNWQRRFSILPRWLTPKPGFRNIPKPSDSNPAVKSSPESSYS